MAWEDEGRASPECFGEIHDVSAKHKCDGVRPADLKPHSLEPPLKLLPQTRDYYLSLGDGENTIDSRAMNFQSQTSPLSMYFATLG